MAFETDKTSHFFRQGKLATLEDGSSAKVYIDFPEQLEDFSGQSRTGQVKQMPVMTYETASLVLAHGTVVTIGEAKFRVRWTRKTSDAAVSEAELEVVNG